MSKKISIDVLLSKIELLERQKKALEQLVVTDPLTNIYNRRGIIDLIEDALKRGNRYEEDMSLVFIDLDYFKKINDTYGHPVGDQILIALVDIMKQSVRSIDQIGRLSGDEFIILLPQTNVRGARKVAETLRKKMESKFFSVKGKIKNFTISAGITGFVKDFTVSDYLRILDVALYRAKKKGKNQIILAKNDE